jgi:predicted transcriptional regulator
MESLCDLFFELSNEERLRIFLLLDEKTLKMTHISRELDLTVQETSRHLSRLSDKKLIRKNVEGFHSLTSYGEQIFGLIPGFKFLSKHREYFTKHKISHIPRRFLNGIGDLYNSSLTDDVLVAFHNVENRIRNAEEYLWILSDQVLMSSVNLLIEAMKRGAHFKVIMPKDLTPPQGFKNYGEQQSFGNATASQYMETRFADKVEVAIVMSEKEAGITFPTLDGRIDYGFGFITNDQLGHNYCKEVFLYYWNKASKEIPNNFLEI